MNFRCREFQTYHILEQCSNGIVPCQIPGWNTWMRRRDRSAHISVLFNKLLYYYLVILLFHFLFFTVINSISLLSVKAMEHFFRPLISDRQWLTFISHTTVFSKRHHYGNFGHLTCLN